MAKQKFKIINWCNYNKVLINRASITTWLDDEAIQTWYEILSSGAGRFNQILKRNDDISQKMLSRTLKNIE